MYVVRYVVRVVTCTCTLFVHVFPTKDFFHRWKYLPKSTDHALDESPVPGAGASPGSAFVTCSADNTVRLWSVGAQGPWRFKEGFVFVHVAGFKTFWANLPSFFFLVGHNDLSCIHTERCITLQTYYYDFSGIFSLRFDALRSPGSDSTALHAELTVRICCGPSTAAVPRDPENGMHFTFSNFFF